MWCTAAMGRGSQGDREEVEDSQSEVDGGCGCGGGGCRCDSQSDWTGLQEVQWKRLSYEVEFTGAGASSKCLRLIGWNRDHGGRADIRLLRQV